MDRARRGQEAVHARCGKLKRGTLSGTLARCHDATGLVTHDIHGTRKLMVCISLNDALTFNLVLMTNDSGAVILS